MDKNALVCPVRVGALQCEIPGWGGVPENSIPENSGTPTNCCDVQGAKNIAKIPLETCLWASAVAGAGAGLIGALVGVPLLIKQRKVWESTM